MMGLDQLKYRLESVNIGLDRLILVCFGECRFGSVIFGLGQLISV